MSDESSYLPQSPPPEYSSPEYPPPTTSPDGSSQEPGCWAIGLRVTAAILAVLFVLAMPTALFLFNMERIAFNPETYKQALVGMGFYDQLPSLLGGMISDGVARNPADNQALASLSRSDVQGIAAALITRDWAQQQTESVIDQLFGWLDSDSPTISVVVSLDQVKKQMAGPEGKQIVVTIVNSWPPCTDTQILAASAAVIQGNMNQLPLCRPPDELMPALTPYLAATATQSAASMPSTVDLAAPNGIPTPIDAAHDPRPALRLYRGIARFSLILPLLLLLGIALAIIRSWKSLALWGGIPLVIAGIAGLLVAVLMLPLHDMLAKSMYGVGSPIPVSFQDVFTRMLGSVFQTVGWWIAGESLVIAVAGGIVILAGYLMNRSLHPSVPSIESTADGYTPS